MLHAQHWGARWPCDLYGRTSGSVCLGRELWAGSLPPRHPRAPSVTLKQSENTEQQKSKRQEQAVKLYGQLLNELIILGFFLLYSFLMLSNYYSVTVAAQQKSLWGYIHYWLVRPLLIPSRLGIIGIYGTEKILTSALTSSGKAIFFRLFEGDPEKQKMEKSASW